MEGGVTGNETTSLHRSRKDVVLEECRRELDFTRVGVRGVPTEEEE